MQSNRDRQRHFSTFRSPTPDEENYQAFVEFQKKKIKSDPKLKSKLKGIGEKAFKIANPSITLPSHQYLAGPLL